VPIIADAFQRTSDLDVPLDAKSVRDWIEQFKTSAGADAQGYFRTADGWLIHRDSRFWQLFQEEPPERLISLLDNRDAHNIDTYAKVMASLTPLQIANVCENPEFAAMFPRSSLASAANSLALWGRLSSAQKMASRSESGIGLDNLTPEQAELMLKAATMTLQSNLTDKQRDLALRLTRERLPLRLFVTERSDNRTALEEIFRLGSGSFVNLVPKRIFDFRYGLDRETGPVVTFPEFKVKEEAVARTSRPWSRRAARPRLNRQ
jgi:hypothetical protein